jgi:carbamoyl-phosphate synthase small subunit
MNSSESQTQHVRVSGCLRLEDGRAFKGVHFGSVKPIAGEVVFNTGMVGYTEALTDPSYKGQILVLTYPLVGNYGVPNTDSHAGEFESARIQVSGLIVSEICREPNHWNAAGGLAQWLQSEGVPALCSIDTRALTKRLRLHGTMMGSIDAGESKVDAIPSAGVVVAEVSVERPILYERGEKRLILIDCGCKESIVRNLLDRNFTVLRVPHDYDFSRERYDGVVVSNGPGDPKACDSTIVRVRELLTESTPVLGICLGSQILALAAGGNTYKLKYGHRGQNQPCVVVGTKRCYITSQNHGYAVDPKTLPPDWDEWFVNANDGTNEGIRHRHKPFYGVQFHPEAAPGPNDANFLFDDFLRSCCKA